jgi:nicotinamide-nucleotide amidase
MDEVIERRLGQLLREQGQTIAVAESCTGGLVGSLLTDVVGSSEYFIGGIISYMNQSKLQSLAVSREALEQHGAVSNPVAREMAQHIRDEANATWGVSTTGYAGPSEESSDEPPGSVYIGIAFAGEFESKTSFSLVEHHQFEGNRKVLKNRIAKQALESVYFQIQSKRPSN